MCLDCGHRFFTNEIVCEEYPTVIKRDGREEGFDKKKIKIGLMKAFKKCIGVEERVEEIYKKVLAEVVSAYVDKIKSEAIGSIIMEILKASDQVAYLRFASVYKNFETADDFACEFKKISSKE
jgi:transcriptional repressor NrdR